MKIVYNPSPIQRRFHESSADWIILGGNRGGGKSTAILIEALGLAYNAPAKGGWHVLILRRTYDRLEELIKRSNELYPSIVRGITYNKSTRTWTYPNGSTIQFGGCEYDKEIEKYRGQQYNLIIWDELSEFNLELWDFMKGSNRNSKGYPDRMLATTNPCKWIKEWLGIDDDGNDLKKTFTYVDPDTGIVVKQTLQFMKCEQEEMVKEGHLTMNYRAAMASLTNKEQRDQWYLGKWTNPKIPGLVLGPELDIFDEERRLIPLTRERALPVHVFTDLGWSDSTVLLFVQFVQNNINILDFYTNSQCITDHYIEKIHQMYPDAIVHLPHDGSKHNDETGKTKREYWEERVRVSYDSGVNGNLPRPASDPEAIQRVRLGFKNVWINSQSERCIKFLDHLKNYKRRWNEKENEFGDPIEGVHSHSFDGLKYIFYYEKPSTSDYLTVNPTKPYIAFA